MKPIFFIIIWVFIVVWGCGSNATSHITKSATKFNPENYVCNKTTDSIIIDGKLGELSWEKSVWTNDFVDIEGDLKPEPTYKTNVKMLWDDEYLYIGARLEEPHVWATLKQRDTIIFYDNDFEVFIDPNSDSHEYYELEVNAYGTEWDLMLTKPYRDNGRAINNWDINGLKTGIHVNGTINDPSDIDKAWFVELAIPWKVLKECAHKAAPPKNNDQWRMGFSRVQWQTEIVNNTYRKVINPETGKPFPEDNWVWSPQGVIAMHQPETWGIVEFVENKVGSAEIAFTETEEYEASWLLYNIYYALHEEWENKGQYPKDINKIVPLNHSLSNYNSSPEYLRTLTGYELLWKGSNGAKDLLLNNEGKLTKK